MPPTPDRPQTPEPSPPRRRATEQIHRNRAQLYVARFNRNIDALAASGTTADGRTARLLQIAAAADSQIGRELRNGIIARLQAINASSCDNPDVDESIVLAEDSFPQRARARLGAT